MVWAQAIEAGIGAGVTAYESARAQNRTEAETAAAIQRETDAAQEATRRQQLAMRQAQTTLRPFAAQETAASQQMMAQLGLEQPAPSAYATSDPFQPYAVDPGAQMGTFAGPTGAEAQDNFLSQLLSEAIANAGRAGYGSNKKPSGAINEGARAALEHMESLEGQGKLPEGMEIPTIQELTTMGTPLVDRSGGLKTMREQVLQGYSSRDEPSGKVWGAADVDRLLETHFPQVPEAAAGQLPGQQMGAPGGPGAVAAGAGPAPQTISDIMGRAGAEGLPEGFSQDYFRDLAAGGQQIDLGFGTDFRDPEFQSYMGLTRESMDPSGYQDSPAYAAAREAGIEAVNVGAAGAGGLYSGRRGEALRDVGQEVEQKYYFDAADRLRQMMEARRGEYGEEYGRRATTRREDLSRRGGVYEQGQQRGQSYYNNYMQMLSGMASPTTTTNLATMEQDIGRETGTRLMSTARDVSDLSIGGAGAEQAARADMMGGLVDLGTAFLEDVQIQ